MLIISVSLGHGLSRLRLTRHHSYRTAFCPSWFVIWDIDTDVDAKRIIRILPHEIMMDKFGLVCLDGNVRERHVLECRGRCASTGCLCGWGDSRCSALESVTGTVHTTCGKNRTCVYGNI